MMIRATKGLDEAMYGVTGSLIEIRVKLMHTLFSKALQAKFLQSQQAFDAYMHQFMAMQTKYAALSQHSAYPVPVPPLYASIEGQRGEIALKRSGQACIAYRPLVPALHVPSLPQAINHNL